MVLPIHSLQNDQSGQIVWLASSPADTSRLRCFGFIPGQKVTCILSQVPGGMRAFRVGNSVIGLSPQTCREIFVHPLPQDDKTISAI